MLFAQFETLSIPQVSRYTEANATTSFCQTRLTYFDGFVSFLSSFVFECLPTKKLLMTDDGDRGLWRKKTSWRRRRRKKILIAITRGHHSLSMNHKLKFKVYHLQDLFTFSPISVNSRDSLACGWKLSFRLINSVCGLWKWIFRLLVVVLTRGEKMDNSHIDTIFFERKTSNFRSFFLKKSPRRRSVRLRFKTLYF